MHSFDHRLPDTHQRSRSARSPGAAQRRPRGPRHSGAVAAAAANRSLQGDRGDRSRKGRRRLPSDECRAAHARLADVSCHARRSDASCSPARCMPRSPASMRWWSAAPAISAGRSPSSSSPSSATVTVAHSKTRDLPAVCRRADLLLVAIGRPEIVRGDWIKPGATVIDIGINRVTGRGGTASSAMSPFRKPSRSPARSRQCRAASVR